MMQFNRIRSELRSGVNIFNPGYTDNYIVAHYYPCKHTMNDIQAGSISRRGKHRASINDHRWCFSNPHDHCTAKPTATSSSSSCCSRTAVLPPAASATLARSYSFVCSGGWLGSGSFLQHPFWRPHCAGCTHGRARCTASQGVLSFHGCVTTTRRGGEL